MTSIFFVFKKRPLLILGITALMSSRMLFFFFDDPEGPNLLVVTVTAAIVYLVCLTTYAFDPSVNDTKRFWLAVFIQVILIISLYFLGLKF